jgi:hypothetical protein
MVFWGVVIWSVIGIILAERLMAQPATKEVLQLTADAFERNDLPKMTGIMEAAILWWASVLWPLTLVILWRGRGRKAEK